MQLPSDLTQDAALRTMEFEWVGGELRFAVPRDSLTPTQVATLRVLRPKIVALLKGASGPRSTTSEESSTSRNVELLPVTRLQAEFVESYPLVSDNDVPHIRLDLRVCGPLDVSILTDALQTVIRRQGALRTRFGTTASGRVLAAEDGGAGIRISTTDMSEPSQSKRRETAFDLAVSVGRSRFDLRTAPLMRAHLIKLGDREYILVVVVHHVIWDAWSTEVFVTELSTVYNCMALGRPLRLPDLHVQSSDFAVWQSLHMQSTEGKLQTERRIAQLGGASSELLLDNVAGFFYEQEPASPAARVPILRFSLSTEQTAVLQRLAIEVRCTPWMIPMAAFLAVAMPLSRQQERTVSTVHFGRTHPEFFRLIGCFVDQFLLRVSLTGDPSFLELLNRVRTAFLEVAPDLDIPYCALAPHITSCGDDPHYARLGFNYVSDALLSSARGKRLREDDDDRRVWLSHYSWPSHKPVDYPSGSTHITGHFSEHGGRLAWSIRHGRRFSTRAINSLSAQLERLLSAVSRVPTLTLSQLSGERIDAAP